MAAMLARRQWFKDCWPVYRYLSFDASPIKGVEWFVTVERVVDAQQASRSVGPAGRKPDVSSRLLPLQTLGCCRMSLADKLQAHVHQVWLEYGPSVADVRRANMAVRQCLSDMGTGRAIGDAADTVAQCVDQQDSRTAGQQEWLYPLALAVPGTQHILDSALTRGLSTLDWWPEWQRCAKVTCQWLRAQQHRDLLIKNLQDSFQAETDGQLQQLVSSLQTSVEGFAEWRWKTLNNATRDLGRVREAVCSAIATVMSSGQLASSTGGQAAVFLASASDPSFWRRSAALREFTEPMGTFSSWLRGCECHDLARQDGKLVECPWAGCRAPQMASRTAQALDELAKLRQRWVSDTDGIATAITASLASLQYKMERVYHEPFTIWQARRVGSTHCFPLTLAVLCAIWDSLQLCVPAKRGLGSSADCSIRPRLSLAPARGRTAGSGQADPGVPRRARRSLQAAPQGHQASLPDHAGRFPSSCRWAGHVGQAGQRYWWL